MHIVIYGLGGVGGYFGGKLAKAGNNVTFIARGAHLKAVQEYGLQVKSIDGDFTIQPTLATDTISDVPKADLVILSVKSWQIPEIAEQLKPILHSDSAVLPLQNGADNVEKLVEVLPEHQVLGGFCKIYSKKETDGVIDHFGVSPAEVVLGELNNKKTERVAAIARLFNEAGCLGTVAEDIQKRIWSKFIFITTVSAIGGLTRVSIGAMRDVPYLYDVLKNTALEIKAIANAKGINLTDDDMGALFNFIDKQPYEATASTQRDIMAGHPSELENFNGYIVKEGKRLGIPTPVNEFIYYCLVPQEKIARTS
ncbi:2-dehydropantoate 2-reductase [Pustulibacterium marinum]|uniref:2-dehydropantoate 2-reductase n=1 Tax=Pustulibacterium marinum TaxID=1224947 RepID=A0A1I7EXR9_9FLAO|nr:2-dehydropantoate 2-reductase [Pustulibacterium marinum]SFU28685.1 2-dehydropantoate 2-reductase [Pustulibacterium marinum]